MGARSTLSFNDFLVGWLLFPGSKILPGKENSSSTACPLHICSFVHFAVSLDVSQTWSEQMKCRVPSINSELVHVHVGIKLFMQIGWSYRVGSIKGDLDRLKLHTVLIRQPAAMLNKWKCIPFPSFPSICLCVLRHPEEFNRTLILHLIFPTPHCFPSLSASISLHLSSHTDSLSHRIPVVVSNQGNHSESYK